MINNQDPLNGTEFTPGEVNVSVDVEDPEGDDTIVEIYNETVTDSMGSKRLISGGPANVNATYDAFDYGETYEWEVVAYRNGTPSKKTTRVFYFETKTNPQPQVTDYYPKNGSKLKPGNFERNVTIDDPNNDHRINVTFYEGGMNPGDKIGEDQIFGGNGVARVNEPAKGSGKTFTWYVKIDDGSNIVTKVYKYNTRPDAAPKFSNASPKDNVTIESSPVELSAVVKDDFASNIDVKFEDDNGNTIRNYYEIGEGEYANASYSLLTDETSYNWTIIAEDNNGNTNSSEFRFYYDRPPFRPVKASIESNYTDIILTESSSTIVPFKVTNPSFERDLNISIDSEVKAKFVDGGTFKEVTMEHGTRTFLVEVAPESSGNKEISLQVENRDYGTFVTDTKNVNVQESSSSYEQVAVPGIGLVQIYSLLIISSLAYFALL